MFARGRQQQSTKGAAVTQPAIFPAPRNGWVRNAALSGAKATGGAEVLDNFFPTTEGVRLRGGRQNHATCDVGAKITAIMPYDVFGSEKMFAADATHIYDVTSPADPDAEIVASISGLTSGYWSSTVFSTTGGRYLVAVNGADSMRRWDGAAWSTISGAITGVATAALSHVWQWKRQLMFIEAGTMKAWSLPALAIAGAAVEINLGTLFKLGGELLFGATWSTQDVGDSADDRCVFVTTKGEVAVYQGTDPSSSATWSLVGVYQIGEPLGKNATVRVGGDLLVVTNDGIIPISAVLSRDELALKLAAITYPIEEAWRSIVRYKSDEPFAMAIWPAENMLIVCVPQTQFSDRFVIVANVRTGAWARYTNWDGRHVATFDGKLYFGDGDGVIHRGEVTGLDDATPYTGIIVWRFSDFKSAATKVAVHARIVARTNRACEPLLSVCVDYDTTVPTAPSAPTEDLEDSLWNEALWDSGVWAAQAAAFGPKAAFSEWQSVDGIGSALAPVVQVTSGRIAAPDIEVIRADVLYEVGDVVV